MNAMEVIVPDNIEPTATHVVFLSNNKENLLTPPSKVEEILLHKSLLYVGLDGKLYFTPQAIRYYVSKAIIKLGEPEHLLMPGVNPF